MGSLGPTGLCQQPPIVPMTTANEALSSLETRGAAQAARPSLWNREDTHHSRLSPWCRARRAASGFWSWK